MALCHCALRVFLRRLQAKIPAIMLDVVHAARRADEDFGARLTALIPNLRAFAQSLCRNRDSAEDLAQDSIMNAWKARASFEPGTNLKAWLFVIQRNAHYSANRRRWREVELDEDTMERRLVTGPSQHASAELSDLARAMSSLPGEQRDAMVLVGAGGFSYKHAASMQGCATGTMKSRVSRGRQAVTSLMADNFALPPRASHAGNAMQSITRDLAALSAMPRSRAH